MGIDDAAWYRLTANALGNWRNAFALLHGKEGADSDRDRHFKWYAHVILGAWQGYRPDGPLVGECLPNEVMRLQRIFPNGVELGV